MNPKNLASIDSVREKISFLKHSPTGLILATPEGLGHSIPAKLGSFGTAIICNSVLSFFGGFLKDVKK